MDFLSLSGAIEKAKELGAVKYAASYYPRKFLDPRPSVSFLYFFNADGLEVANWMLSLNQFPEVNNGFQPMSPPRQWHDGYLNELSFIGI